MINVFIILLIPQKKIEFIAPNIFIHFAKILYLEHLNYKNRASWSGSIQPNTYTIPNSILLDIEEKPKKKELINIDSFFQHLLYLLQFFSNTHI